MKLMCITGDVVYHNWKVYYNCNERNDLPMHVLYTNRI